MMKGQDKISSIAREKKAIERIRKLNFLYACIVLEELRRNGVKIFIVSPGYRSAPLVWALNFIKKRDPTIISIPAIDERAGAYVGLGASKARGVASVLICTSGTAIANYYPAIIEAKRDQIPMIVLSADRPLELVNSDGNQTINQQELFSKFSKYNLNMLPADSNYSPQALVTEIDYLISIAHGLSSVGGAGPVHINIPFREPLWESEESSVCCSLVIERFIERKLVDLYSYNKDGTAVKIIAPLIKDTFAEILDDIFSFERILIIVGRLMPTTELDSIVKMIELLSELLSKNRKHGKINVHYDVSSSLRFGRLSCDLDSWDGSFSSPQLILHLGGRILSNNFYKNLQKIKDKKISYYLINDGPYKQDPAHRVDLKLHCSPEKFALQALAYIKENIEVKNIEVKNVKVKNTEAKNERKEKETKQQLAEEIFYKNMVEMIAENTFENGHDLYLANSMTVRLFDKYLPFIRKDKKDNKRELRVITNRGVSGIEGFIASAFGYALASGSKDSGPKNGRGVTLVLGDLALIHDLNSILFLSNDFLKQYNLTLPPLAIVVINNFGGGIFKKLLVGKGKGKEVHITTPHPYSFANFFKAVNVNYSTINISISQTMKQLEYKKLERKIHKLFEMNASAGLKTGTRVLEIVLEGLEGFQH
ncbi:MAG: 2-succinyl-5-enolpyruvyl-6-hydroxy-3-cyclohexene-1-carboxylic-acid synthase [Oligoflexia bacterium]|nr:2-succinyl-5-enolpyruvyl-6-hydroxy-3-cyclohexene-1-carboxylic-acid synthase [Oligoflexia bacterium]